MCFLTYSWTRPPEHITGHTVSLHEFLIVEAWDPLQCARAVQRAHVDVQCPHVVTQYVAIHWKVNKN